MPTAQVLPPLPVPGGVEVLGVPGLLAGGSDLCLHHHTAFSECLCPNFPPLIRTPVMLD